MDERTSIGKSFEEWLRAGQPQRKVELEAVVASVPSSVFAAVPREDRPAYPVVAGAVTALDAEWIEPLAAAGPAIARAAQGVAQILLSTHAGLPMAGTGFLIAPQAIVTNLHVVSHFMTRNGDAWARRQAAGGTVRARACFADTRQQETPDNSFEIDSILFWDRSVGGSQPVDLVVCGLASDSGRQPLPLAASCPDDLIAAVVGYPSDELPPDPAARERLLQVFGHRFFARHLSPGALSRRAGLLTHDCSTNFGHSGSPIVDLASGNVVAIHQAGADVFNLALPIESLHALLVV